MNHLKIPYSFMVQNSRLKDFLSFTNYVMYFEIPKVRKMGRKNSIETCFGLFFGKVHCLHLLINKSVETYA